MEGQAFLIQGPGFSEPSLGLCQSAEVSRRQGDPAFVLKLPADRKALFVERTGCGVVSLLKRDIAQVVEGRGDTPAVGQFLTNCQALVQKRVRRIVIRKAPR